ncbi:MAG TPA: alpha-ketoglutarate-dependent dioxygenase AlkB [Burkholderiales bacterium]|nr:alpha-ketoglutarate-dependent dioxygenase AlkB [Burkholderiales bacterium]
MSASQKDLFAFGPALPEGYTYQPEFITAGEEASLIAFIRTLPLEEAKYKEYTAKRRTVSYGFEYDFSMNRMGTAPELPAFLMPLREKVSRWTDEPAEDFVHALVNEYRPGTQLGWHRDVPNFEVIVGVSLAGACRMRLRPYRPGEKNRRQDVINIELEPRSAYVMKGPARWGWQHSIAPTAELRYSITLRTARRNA